MVNFKPEVEELEEARKQVREGIKRAKKFFPKEKEVNVGFGWTEREFTKEKMDGASGLARSPTYFEIDFNSNVEGWKTSVLGTTIHEFSHTYFYEKRGVDHTADTPIWLYILDEALTQNTTEKLAPEAAEPWRKEHSKEEIAEHWSKIKEEELDRNYQYPDPLYINKNEGGYPNWLGYSLSYLIGKKLLEKGHSLEEFPELTREDVVKAGDKLFGDSE